MTGYLQQGAQAPGIAEGQRSQVQDHRPAVAIYDIPDLADRYLGAGDIQLAVQIHHDLATRADLVAQFNRRRFLRITPAATAMSSPMARLNGQPGAPVAARLAGRW